MSRVLASALGQQTLLDQMTQPTALSVLQKAAQGTESNFDLERPYSLLDAIANGHSAALKSHSLFEHTPAYRTLLEEAQSYSRISDYINTQSLAHKVRERFINPIQSLCSTNRTLPSSVFASEYLDVNIIKTGFCITALSGIEGLSGGAITANILSRFADIPDSPSELFNQTLSTFQHLPDETLQTEEFKRSIENALNDITTALKKAESRSQFETIISIIGVVFGAFSILLSLLDGEQSQQLSIVYEQPILEASLKETRDRIRHDSTDIRFVAGHWNLRTQATTESDVIETLNSDQVVTVNKIEGDWAFVIVHSYAGEDPKEGWINRDGLIAR